jgi:hypothetical protein
LQQLNTVDQAKVLAFEYDPCGQEQLEVWQGLPVGRGNCSEPDTCTCLCKRKAYRDANGDLVEAPWVDPLAGMPTRELEPGYIYGTSMCLEGYEGLLLTDEEVELKRQSRERWSLGLDALHAQGGKSRSGSTIRDVPFESQRDFRTCHLTIYVPTWFERNTIIIFIAIVVTLIVLGISYFIIRRRMRQRFEAMKRQRRETRRTSEESTRPHGFAHNA